MFTARIKLTGPTVSFHPYNLRGGGFLSRTITINDEARKKKLSQLLKLLKKQKCKPEIEYDNDNEGNLVAVIRV